MLLHGLSKPKFSGDLVYKLMQIVGNLDLSIDIKGYNVDIMRQNACLVVNLIKVAAVFKYPCQVRSPTITAQF